MDRAKVWLHYRGDQDDVKAAMCVKDVKKIDVGKYKVTFQHPFSSGNYAVVATSTAGVACIRTNLPDSVIIKNCDMSGQAVDSEVFLVAFGERQ